MTTTTPRVRYQIYCISQGQWVGREAEENGSMPMICPNDAGHEVNPDSLQILPEDLDPLQPASITLGEEPIITGANYRSESFSLTAAPSTTVTRLISWPFRVTVLRGEIFNPGENKGDTVTMRYTRANVGVLTSVGSIGDTVLHVSAPVIAMAKLGFDVYLTNDSSVSTNVGRVTNVNGVAGTITIFPALITGYVSGRAVALSRALLDNVEFGSGPSTELFNNGRHMGNSLSANMIATVTYTNVQPTGSSHTMTLKIEYLY